MTAGISNYETPCTHEASDSLIKVKSYSAWLHMVLLCIGGYLLVQSVRRYKFAILNTNQPDTIIYVRTAVRIRGHFPKSKGGPRAKKVGKRRFRVGVSVLEEIHEKNSRINWSDYKTNAQTAKESYFSIYLDRNEFSSQFCFISSIAFLALFPDCNNTKTSKIYIPLFWVMFICFRNFLLKLWPWGQGNA